MGPVATDGAALSVAGAGPVIEALVTTEAWVLPPVGLGASGSEVALVFAGPPEAPLVVGAGAAD